MGPKWVPNWSLGAPWEDPWGTPGVWGTDKAPGAQQGTLEVIKVCNGRQKQPRGHLRGSGPPRILGTPRGLSNRPH